METARRHFVRAAAAALAASPWLKSQAAPAASADPLPTHDMRSAPAHWTGHEQVAMLLYPGFTALDFVGPQYMLASLMGAKVHHVAATLAPVTSDTGLSLVPTLTLADCPRELDILFIPGGGQGTLAAMKDAALLDFVADRGSRARWVSSVCTGSLILGAAGLLRGYRATSHWIARDLLAEVGATPVDARVVQDRNRITGAGVSAGLDLGLRMVGLLRDPFYAQTLQLLAEYAPEPPWNAGTPHTAPPEARAMLEAMFQGFTANSRAVLQQRAHPSGAAPGL